MSDEMTEQEFKELYPDIEEGYVQPEDFDKPIKYDDGIPDFLKETKNVLD